MRTFTMLSIGFVVSGATMSAAVSGCGSKTTVVYDEGGSTSSSGSGSGGSTSGGSTSGGSTSGGSTSGGSSGGSSGGTASSSGGDGGSSGCTLSTAAANAAGCPLCVTCEQTMMGCCPIVNACLADPGCAAIVSCQSSCYSGVGPDGGMFDASLDDAGGGPAADCANNCTLMDAGATGNTKFTAYDNCNSNVCGTQCSCP
jgi:hypothetical protein